MKTLRDLIVEYLDNRKDVIMNNQEFKKMRSHVYRVTGFKVEISTLQTLASHHKNTLARKGVKND